MRPLLAIAAGAGAAAAGAVILGEYDMSGATPLYAGPVLGVAVAEVVHATGRTVDLPLTVAVALVIEAALVWSVWISTGHRLDLAAPTAWAGVVLGTAAGAAWFYKRGSASTAQSDRRST